MEVSKLLKIGALAALLSLRVCMGSCPFIRRVHSLLHNKLIMVLFTADRAVGGGVMRADGATQET